MAYIRSTSMGSVNGWYDQEERLEQEKKKKKHVSCQHFKTETLFAAIFTSGINN